MSVPHQEESDKARASTVKPVPSPGSATARAQYRSFHKNKLGSFISPWSPAVGAATAKLLGVLFRTYKQI